MAGPKKLSFQILGKSYESLIQTSPEILSEPWIHDSKYIKDKYLFKIYTKRNRGERKEMSLKIIGYEN